MNQTPEEIRADIDRTRAQLSGDVDALAEKVSPTAAVGRQTERVKAAVGDVKDRIFGVDDRDPGAVGHAAEDVRHAADRAVQKAKGNPLAVGLVAFGLGAVLAGLIPASRKEAELAQQAKEAAQPVVDQARDIAKEVGENLKQPAQDAAESVKDAAKSAGENVRDEAQGAASDVRDDADRARQNVQDEAQR